MFKQKPKSIIIFSKEPIEKNRCLLVELPSFTNPVELNKALIKIDNWFLEKGKKEVK